MLDLLLVVTLAVHLVAVNVAAAGPLYCVAIEWRGVRRGDAAAIVVARRLAWGSLWAFLSGIGIGGALLAFLWNNDRPYAWALARVPAQRWWFFGGEVVFYLVCMIAYVALWQRASRQRWWHRLLAIFAATNLLYHFPPLFTMISLMSTRPELTSAVLDRSLYVELFTDGETLARVAHHWLSAVATTGVLVMLVGSRKDRSVDSSAPSISRAWAAIFGARAALAATALQLPAGVWLLLVSSADVQSRLLGGDVAGMVLFGSAIVAMLVLLQFIAAAALGDDSRGTAIKAAVLLIVVLLLMSAVLDRMRSEEGNGRHTSPFASAHQPAASLPGTISRHCRNPPRANRSPAARLGQVGIRFAVLRRGNRSQTILPYPRSRL